MRGFRGGHLSGQAEKLGHSVNHGIAAGIDKSRGAVNAPIKGAAQHVISSYKQVLRSASPAQALYPVGESIPQGVGVGITQGTGAATASAASSAGAITGAMGDALGQASSGAIGVASNLGLKVGFVYGQSMVDGTVRVLQKSKLQAEGLPKGISPEAMRNLAGTGLVNAGSGAQTWRNDPGAPTTVTFGAGSQPVQVTVNLDGQQLHQQIYDVADSRAEIHIDTALRQLASTVSAQRG